MERRFQSPYRHWVSGLIIEVAVLAGFTIALALLAAAVSWLAG